MQTENCEEDFNMTAQQIIKDQPQLKPAWFRPRSYRGRMYPARVFKDVAGRPSRLSKPLRDAKVAIQMGDKYARLNNGMLVSADYAKMIETQGIGNIPNRKKRRYMRRNVDTFNRIRAAGLPWENTRFGREEKRRFDHEML